VWMAEYLHYSFTFKHSATWAKQIDSLIKAAEQIDSRGDAPRPAHDRCFDNENTHYHSGLANLLASCDFAPKWNDYIDVSDEVKRNRRLLYTFYWEVKVLKDDKSVMGFRAWGLQVARSKSDWCEWRC